MIEGELRMGLINRREFVALTAGAAALQAATNMNSVLGQDVAPAGLAELTLSEASRRIHAHEVTSVQLTQAVLERSKVYNPIVNAYITLMHKEALAQAEMLDAEAKAGKFRSPLHGIPIALKDNIDTAGTRTTGGSQVFDDRVPDEDAEVVTKLKEAGAVILAKANMHEFASGGSSASTYFLPVRNPWALDHIPAGSSGGSAAAVSADMAYGALGTDTGGSVRMPAAYCSVVGLMPTYGLVSIRGIIPLTYSLDHCGPLARTVEDCAMMLNHMTGYDKKDVASVEHPKEDYVAALKQPISGMRLGIPRAPFFDRLDPEVEKAVEEAIAVLSKMTKETVDDCHLPGTAGFNALALGGEREAYHLELYRRNANRYSLSLKNSFGTAQKTMDDVSSEPCSEKVVDYVTSNWKLILLRKSIDDAFTNFDLVVLPTMRILPRTIDDSLAREEDPKPTEPEPGSNCGPFDAYGIPAISIPCGFSSTGLPIGLMIAGPRFSEGKVMALAQAYEKTTQWHTKRPPLTPGMTVPPIHRK
jgi:aspartyl-tRNA(Asn)/glutamyl-tRNA(Gln) amidotransferase subunit A